MINRVILEGRLGNDPEKFVTPSGRTRVRFSLPLFNPYHKEGDPTEWIQCEVWNQPAEYISQYGKKGFLVSVDGRLRNQRYQDKDGNTRYNVYISVDRLTLLESRNRTNGESASSTSSAPSSNNKTSVSNPSSQSVPSSNPSNIDDLFKDFDGLMGN